MEKLKYGLLGLNYDTEAGRGWPGARYAPDSIRRAMSGIMNRMEDGFLFDVNNNRLVDYNKIDFKDFGNCDNIVHYEHYQGLKDMAEEIKKVMAEGYKPILLGGDHSVTNAGFMALHDVADGRIGIIDFDAHLDIKVDSPVQGRSPAPAKSEERLKWKNMMRTTSWKSVREATIIRNTTTSSRTAVLPFSQREMYISSEWKKSQSVRLRQ